MYLIMMTHQGVLSYRERRRKVEEEHLPPDNKTTGTTAKDPCGAHVPSSNVIQLPPTLPRINVLDPVQTLRVPCRSRLNLHH